MTRKDQPAMPIREFYSSLTDALRAVDGLVLVVTGAGVSAASGVSTFRGSEPDAVWRQHDVSMANRETATAQIAELETKRLQLKIRLLENRAENLEIKSPVDGVVVHGDATRSEGSRLTIGQPLMEVGPLEQVKAELSIDDEDIEYVRVGQPVTVRLDSHPRMTFEGRLRSIPPRAEERDSENVFVGEVYLNNEQAILRPGMRGYAKVRSRKRPFAWILFHKAWYQILFRLGW